MVLVAFGLLSICVGILSGCDSKPADGSLVEPPEISAAQTAEVGAENKQQSLERRRKFSKKGKTARR
jgi:hypothetical protein